MSQILSGPPVALAEYSSAIFASGAAITAKHKLAH
jgi:hypothetical protein